MTHPSGPSGRPGRRVRHAAAGLALALGGTAMVLALAVWRSSLRTEREIDALEARVAAICSAAPAPAVSAEADFAALPAPVQRSFAYVFRGPVKAHGMVRIEADGDFRRPQTETFAPTTAGQVIAVGTPALMFSATTPVGPLLWARAFDFFAEGEMVMSARILSTLTVVDERGSPELDLVSLRRWLLESALYPQALLPGGPVRWEPIDETRARAVVEARGRRATMIAHVDAVGRMTSMTAEEDSDPTMSYHGSGEHVSRSDHRQVDGQMIPMRFVISRVADGARHPFWDGTITSIRFR